MKNIFNQKPFIVTPVMEERTILVAYNEGSFFDRFVVHFTRKNNPKVEALYQEHLAVIAQTQESKENHSCPDHLQNRLLDICEERSSSVSIAEILVQFGLTLRATGAIAAMLVLGVMIWSNMGPSKEQREIELATLQAKQSLALISKIMNGTTDDLHDRVIMEYTAKPIHQSIFKGTESIKRNL